MNIKEALEVVHSLAFHNCLGDDTDGEESLIEESKRQDQAIFLIDELLSSMSMESDNSGQLIIYTGKMEGPNGELLDFQDEEER